MNYKKSLFFWLIASYATVFANTPQKDLSSTYSRANNRFAIEMYKKINTIGQNNCFSPYSISSCLSMVLLGANGKTQEEMQKALCMDFSSNILAKSYIEHKNKIQSSLFTIANSVWVDHSTKILPKYQNLLTSYFAGSIQNEDFQNNSTMAVKRINQWIEEATHNRIKDLLDNQSITPSTRMVLVNAIHFLGSWRLPFSPSMTKDNNFYPAISSPTKVKMMHQTERFPYLEQESFQALSLPFSSKEGSFTCIIFLPKENSSIEHFQSLLSEENINSWLQSFQTRKVEVSLPKFTIKHRMDLNTLLISMGMKLPFSFFADFSHINGQKDLYLNKVLHEAFFDMNENGVEAAAATAAIMWAKGAYTPPEMPVVFTANRPFVYMLVEKTTNTILFLGTYQTP